MAQLDYLILGYFVDSKLIGVYSVTYKIGVFVLFVASSVGAVIAPKFSKLYAKDDIAGLKNMLATAIRMNILLTLPVVLVILIFKDYILGLFGSDFKIGTVSLLILVFGQFVNALTGPVGYLLSMTNYEKAVRNTTILACLANIVLNLLLIPKWGISGAAVASMVSIILKNLINFWQVNRKLV